MKIFEKQLQLNIYNFIIRIALIIGVIVFFIFLGAKYFVVLGKMTVKYDFDRKSPYLSLFNPLDRIKEIQCENNDCFQDLISEPVYFRLLTPVNFERAQMEVVFKPENQPILEIGLVANEQNTAISLYPVSNQVLENLIADENWHVVNENDLYLLQKEKKFDNIDDFFSSVPYDQKIAFYNFDFNYDYAIPGYQVQTEDLIIEPFVKGSHNLLIYLESEKLDLNLEFADINKKAGEDSIQVNVYNQAQEKIFSAEIGDDGHFAEEDNILTDEIFQEIKSDNLSDGVLRLEIVTTEDIILKKIVTKQQKIVFDRQVRLLPLDEIKNCWPKYKLADLQLSTVAKDIYLQAFDESALQTAYINDKQVEIKERVTLYKNRFDKFQQRKIFLPNRGLFLQTGGPIAFAENQYFNHKSYNFRSVQNISEADFDFIVARYAYPEKLDDDWYKKTVEIDMNQAYYKDREAKFLFSMPGIEENNGVMRISQINFNLFK